MLLVFLAGFCSIFLLGFQSRNINHGNYAWAAVTAFGIALSQTMLWGALFQHLTWLGAAVYGASGALGVVSAMFVHKRLQS